MDLDHYMGENEVANELLCCQIPKFGNCTGNIIRGKLQRGGTYSARVDVKFLFWPFLFPSTPAPCFLVSSASICEGRLGGGGTVLIVTAIARISLGYAPCRAAGLLS